MNRPTISVVIIAQNEGPRLAKLLPQLAWADEVIVVDGGSRDETLATAASHGARVYQRPFDNFAAQRNFALQRSRYKWVLSLDADEVPTPAFVAELQSRLPRTRRDAFHVPIRSSIFGRRFRYSGTQDDCPIRLFRRGRAFWQGDVHERLQVAGRVSRLRFGLEHETLPDLPTFLAKMHRYTILEAAARVRADRSPRFVDAWLRPPLEVFRRLVWKRGYLDGPQGWAFCLLSGLSEWVLAAKHRHLWRLREQVRVPPRPSMPLAAEDKPAPRTPRRAARPLTTAA